MPQATIFIDESGTLPDPKDKIVVMAAVGVNISKILLDVAREVRKQIKFHKKEKQISEIKFYQAGERTKSIYLKELSKKKIAIFALITEKKGQKIPDTPENFAILAYILLQECLWFYGSEGIEEIIFDKHFHRDIDQKKFDEVLQKLLRTRLKLLHKDSSQNPEVNAADMVAGSLLWKYTGKDEKFYKLIKDRIISERVLNWKEAKRRFFTKME